MAMVTIVDEINVTEEFAADFQEGFCAKVPIPLVDDPEDPEYGNPKYSAKIHLRKWLINKGLRAAGFGLEDIGKATAKKLDKNGMT